MKALTQILIFQIFFNLNSAFLNGQKASETPEQAMAKVFNCNKLSQFLDPKLFALFGSQCASIINRIGPSFKLSQSLDCGQIKVIPGDSRTNVPWTAGIFIKSSNKWKNDSYADYKFYISGIIISPTTVLTVAGGVYGSPPRGVKGRYFIYPPENVIIGAGLKSTNLVDRDEHAQIVNVSYTLPYSGHEPQNREFHFVLYHLKTPLNLRTPFIRSVCLPFLLKEVQNADPWGWSFVQGGFATPKNPDGSFQLRAINVTGGSESECTSAAKFYYKSPSSSHIFCGRKDGNGNDAGCLLHGSLAAFPVSNRWFVGGITALIPSQRRKKCDETTLYIYARTLNHLDWIYGSLKCGSSRFSCGDSENTCVNLKSVCNGIRDCPTGADEDSIFCEAQNRCTETKKNYHECGFGGKCIEKKRLCDGAPDCDAAYDERLPMCTEKNSNGSRALSIVEIGTGKIEVKKTCPPLMTRNGVMVDCLDKGNIANCSSAPIGTVAHFKCDPFTTPKYQLKTIQMTCDKNGAWKDFRPFDCEPECGIVPKMDKSKKRNGEPSSFPWHASIYKMKRGNHKIVCSGTLIEPSFLLTAGNCFEYEDLSVYRVVLGPKSLDYRDNTPDEFTQIYTIHQIWKAGNESSLKPEDDIALVKLEIEITTGGFFRPACYMTSTSHKPPPPGSLGRVSGFGLNGDGKKEEGKEDLQTMLFPVVSKEQCHNSLGNSLPRSTFCAGYINGNGNSLCEGDVGGGIFFQKASQKYVLKGVSRRINGDKKDCENKYSLFTHVDSFSDWLVEIMEKNS